MLFAKVFVGGIIVDVLTHYLLVYIEQSNQ